MSLPTLNWRMANGQAIGTASVGDMLQSIADALADTTWADGSARTAGSGNAWQVISQVGSGSSTEALVIAPPTGSPVENLRVVLAGFPTAKTPTMLAPDTWLANAILLGYARDGGTFTTWDAAEPFGASVHFSGYYRMSPADTYAYSIIYESAEAIAITLTDTSSRDVAAGIVGAIYEPADTSRVSDAEADGRVYGMIVSGSAAFISSTADTVSGRFMDHSASSGQYHNTFTDPGRSSQSNARRLNYGITWNNTNTWLSTDGTLGSMPIHFGIGVATGGRYLGRLREIEGTHQVTHGLRVQNGAAAELGSILAYDDTTDGPSWLLKY